MKLAHISQRGASLIEVLVAILILSFGMLSLSGMLAYAVQMPKLSAYRSTAVMIAASHVERMRANAEGFSAGVYEVDMTFNAPITPIGGCAYPDCTAEPLATMDKYDTSVELRRELPLGGMRMQCDGPCSGMEGDLWVMWQEPSTFAAIGASDSDECPPGETFTIQPRCIHIKFKL